MRTLKLIFIYCSFLYLIPVAKAQESLSIKFGKVTLSDFDIKSPLLDSNTNAIVVADVGTSEFVANTTDLTFSLRFTKKTRIKIINKNGLSAATITIPLYISSRGISEGLEDLKARTYNIENGKIIESNLNKSDVFTEKHSKKWIYKKFTFPAVKDGSLLEYSYSVKSDFYFDFQSWAFQGEYPILWSQYNANIPEFFQYVILSQGYQPFLINKTDHSLVNFTFSQQVERTVKGFGTVTSSGIDRINVAGAIDYHTWVIKNVPGLKLEPFTTTLKNEIAKIEFQLDQVKFPNGMPTFYMNSWEKVSTELLDDEKFGFQIGKANNWLEDHVKNIVNKGATLKEKTKLIYEFVRDNFTCVDKNSIMINTTLKDVFNSKSGSAAEINLMLIAMLRTININADPIILSTRKNGYTHEIYPLIDRFNYVIALVTINDSYFYLDATTPRLPFSKLPSDVYNGHARVISKKQSKPVYFTPDSINEKSATDVFINNNEKGGMEGTYSQQPGFYESLALRDKLSKTSFTIYEKSLRENNGDEVNIENVQIDSLKKLDEPLTIKYDFKLKTFDDAAIVYFNPMISEAIKKNPFIAAERFYPVEMPYTVDDTYNLRMEIPKGYTVDEAPKSVRSSFMENVGKFEYLVSKDAEFIQIRCRLVISKTNFLNEDYQALRDWYSYIIKKEAELVVFKKIK